MPYAQGMQRMQHAIQQVQQRMQHSQKPAVQGQLLLLQHKPVITYTRSKGTQHVLLPKEQLVKTGVDVVVADRGGDVTFHDQGQLVGYPIVPISRRHNFMAIGRYLHALQEALLYVCKSTGVPHCRLIRGKTGVWVCRPGSQPAKLVAVGVGVNAQGISRHGFAVNVCTHLQRMQRCIVPCGLVDTTVTNLYEQLQKLHQPLPSFQQLCTEIARSIAQQLQLAVQWATPYPTTN